MSIIKKQKVKQGNILVANIKKKNEVGLKLTSALLIKNIKQEKIAAIVNKRIGIFHKPRDEASSNIDKYVEEQQLKQKKLLSKSSSSKFNEIKKYNGNRKPLLFFKDTIREIIDSDKKKNVISFLPKLKRFAKEQFKKRLVRNREKTIKERDTSEYKELTRYPKIDIARKEAVGFKGVRIKQPKFWFTPEGRKMYKERETFSHRDRRQYNYMWLNVGRIAQDKLRYMQQVKLRKQAEQDARKRFPKKREWQPKKKLPFAFFQIISKFRKKKKVNLTRYKLWLSKRIYKKLKSIVLKEKLDKKKENGVVKNQQSYSWLELNKKLESKRGRKRYLQNKKRADNNRQKLFDTSFKWLDNDKINLVSSLSVVKDLTFMKPDFNSINWVNSQLYSNLLTPAINKSILTKGKVAYSKVLIKQLAVGNVLTDVVSFESRQLERLKSLIFRSPFKISKIKKLIYEINPTYIPSRNLAWNFNLAYQLVFASKSVYKLASHFKFWMMHSIRQRIKLVALPRLAGLNYMVERMRLGQSINGQFDFSPIYYKIEQPKFSEDYKKRFIYSLFLLRFGKIPTGILTNQHYGDYSLIPDRKLVTVCNSRDRHLSFIRPIAAELLLKISKQRTLIEKSEKQSKRLNKFKNLFVLNSKVRSSNEQEKLILRLKKKKRKKKVNWKIGSYKLWRYLSYYKFPRRYQAKDRAKFIKKYFRGSNFMYTGLRLIRSLIKPNSLFYFRFTKRLKKKFDVRKWSWPKKFFWRKSVKYFYRVKFKKIFYNHMSEDILNQARRCG